ncbi:MAG: hypothetical protein LBN92_05170 [Treponema sp.]|nr:hypothetical protein [Treponema sp.]
MRRLSAFLFFLAAAPLFAQNLTLPENGFSLEFRREEIPEAMPRTPRPEAAAPRITALAGETEAAANTETIFTGAPLWARDLRRAEIVFFGTAPFTFFFARFVFDLTRSASHGWDKRYAPWPVKSGDSVSLEKKDIVVIISAAFTTSLVLALTDYFIVRHERKKEAASIYE